MNALQNLTLVVTNSDGTVTAVPGSLFNLAQAQAHAPFTVHHHHKDTTAQDIHRLKAVGGALGLSGLQNLDAQPVHHHHKDTGVQDINRLKAIGGALGLSELQNLTMVVNHNNHVSVIPGGIF